MNDSLNKKKNLLCHVVMERFNKKLCLHTDCVQKRLFFVILCVTLRPELTYDK